MKKFFQTVFIAIISVFAVPNVSAYSEENELMGIGYDVASELRELEGLGAMLRTNPAASKIVANLKQKAVVKAQISKQRLSLSQQFFLDNLNKLSPGSAQDIKAGNKIFTDSDVFHVSSPLTALSNSVSLIKTGDTFGIGYSALDANRKVFQGQDSVITYISISVAEFLTANGIFSSAFTGLIANSVLFNSAVVNLMIDGKTVLSLPANAFTESRTDKQFNSDGTGFNLKRPILLPAEKVVNVEVIFADDISITPDALSSFAFRVDLMGDGILTR